MRTHPKHLALLALCSLALLLPAGTSRAARAELTPNSVVPFIHDDYPAALKLAREKGVPLFIDTWATWCHSCRWMLAYTFTDPALKPEVGKFVWLSLDGERPQNVAAKNRLKLQAYPTLYVLDPRDERVALRWVGGVPTDRLLGLLADGRKAVATGASVNQGKSSGSADALLTRADIAYGNQDNEEAARLFEQALAVAPPGWAQYPRAVESRLFALSMGEHPVETLKQVDEAWPLLKSTSSAGSLAASGLGAATSLAESVPERATLIARWESESQAALKSRSLVQGADDVSAIYQSLADLHATRGDSALARGDNEALAAYLEHELAVARLPEQKTALDPHVVGVYMELGKPEKALPRLEQSIRDFPEDYNAWVRKSTILCAMHEWKPALEANDRAMAMIYGARKYRAYSVRADIFKGMGDGAGLRATLEEAVRWAEGVPAEERSQGIIRALKKRLDSLPQPSGQAR